MATLTREQKIAKARELRGRGRTYREIGAQIGVDPSTAYDYVTGRRSARVKAWKEAHPDKVRQATLPARRLRLLFLREAAARTRRASRHGRVHPPASAGTHQSGDRYKGRALAVWRGDAVQSSREPLWPVGSGFSLSLGQAKGGRMTFVIEVTYPYHRSLSASPRYAPRFFEAETPEEAVQVYKRESGVEHLDLGWAVERLSTGGKLLHQDRTTGKTVACKELAGALV